MLRPFQGQGTVLISSKKELKTPHFERLRPVQCICKYLSLERLGQEAGRSSSRHTALGGRGKEVQSPSRGSPNHRAGCAGSTSGEIPRGALLHWGEFERNSLGGPRPASAQQPPPLVFMLPNLPHCRNDRYPNKAITASAPMESGSLILPSHSVPGWSVNLPCTFCTREVQTEVSSLPRPDSHRSSL